MNEDANKKETIGKSSDKIRKKDKWGHTSSTKIDDKYPRPNIDDGVKIVRVKILIPYLWPRSFFSTHKAHWLA